MLPNDCQLTPCDGGFPKIVFLDMEGTLLLKAHHLDDGRVAPSAWTLLAERMGSECLAAEEETKRLWLDNRYAGYLDWMAHTVAVHRRFGLRRELFEEVLSSVPTVPGAERAFETLHSWGTVTALVSGGFKAHADRLQRQLGIRHTYAACEYFFDDDGLMTHPNLLPADEEGKVDFMRLLCREYSFNPTDCAFVGDGKNDVHLARAVGFSVAFNAQPELVQVASVSIEQGRGMEDFSAVVDELSKERKRREKEGDLGGI
jgi:phosphoserine phosphatase